jgi:hypothetical protein
MSPPHPGHSSGNSSPTRAMSFAQAFARGIVRPGLLMCVAAAFRGLSAGRMPASHGTALLADVSYCQRRDGPPQLVIRGKHPVVAVPVLPRRWDKVRQTIDELIRRELDDAIGPRPRGLAAAAGPDPVGGPNGDPVSGEDVADFGCAAVWAADHGESLKREGGPGAIPQGRSRCEKPAGRTRRVG